MLENLLVVLMLGAAPDSAVGGPTSHPAPSRGTILRLSQRHAARDWLIVTLDTSRFVTRVHALDERGLVGLQTPADVMAPADPLPWAGIERIDVLKYRRNRGAVIGALAGAVAAVALTGSGDFAFGGAAVGVLAGGALGMRMAHAEELYRAPSSEPARDVRPATAGAEPRPEAPALDSTRAGASSVAGSATPDPLTVEEGRSSLSSLAASDRVAMRLRPGDLLRIQGDFVQRIGHVGSIDATGLRDFRPRGSGGEPAGTIPWESISRIDKRGGSAGSGAMHGAITLGLGVGLLTALVTAAAISLAQSGAGAGAVIEAGFAGAGVGAALGAGLGAGVGSAVPSWRLVYVRR